MKTRPINVVALACLSVGCSLLAPERDRARFFVLTSVVSETRDPLSSVTLGIGPVVVPNYLGRPQIVRRAEDNRIVFSPDDVWGEPLDRGFRRALTEDLGQALGIVDVVQWPWSVAMSIDYQIPIDILRFEADERGTVSLDARWGIRRPGAKAFLLSRESRLEGTARDASTAAVVRTMSDLVGRLSDDIATGIRHVAAANPPRRDEAPLRAR